MEAEETIMQDRTTIVFEKFKAIKETANKIGRSGSALKYFSNDPNTERERSCSAKENATLIRHPIRQPKRILPVEYNMIFQNVIVMLMFARASITRWGGANRIGSSRRMYKRYHKSTKAARITSIVYTILREFLEDRFIIDPHPFAWLLTL